MVAKIGRSNNLYSTLSYNHLKIEKQVAQVLFFQKIIEAPDGSYSIAQLSRSFECYLLANRKTEKPVLHISLNPDPKDKVSDTNFIHIAQGYMQQMGYGEQPFVVFKHTDTNRTHIHIVSVCVDEYGRKISDNYDYKRSMDVCRMLEKQYNLTTATEKKQNKQRQVFKPINYKDGDIKSQMASVLRHLPKYYQFQSFGTFNALLSRFNITAEEVKKEHNGIPKLGIVYFALNDQGEKTSNPFKASLFGKNASYAEMQSHYEQSKIKLKDNLVKELIKGKIETAIRIASSETEFKKQLLEQSINTVVRRNDEGRIYGMTFIDNESRTVWNGSQLGKNLSANVFNDWWNNGNKVELLVRTLNESKNDTVAKEEMHQPHTFFDFLDKENMAYSHQDNNLMETLGGLLPTVQGEDFEEEAFVNRMKRAVKRRKL
jgi:hypothetical protein